MLGFGREVCGDLSVAEQREWLVTNGLGGYASGTVAGTTPADPDGEAAWVRRQTCEAQLMRRSGLDEAPDRVRQLGS